MTWVGSGNSWVMQWGFTQSTSHQEVMYICYLLNAVTHHLYRRFGCLIALSLLKEVFTNLAASAAVAE